MRNGELGDLGPLGTICDTLGSLTVPLLLYDVLGQLFS